MTNNHVMRILFLVFLVFGPICQDSAFAETNGGTHHHHQDMEYNPSLSGDIVASLKTEPEKIIAGTPVTMTVSVKDSLGKPVTDLTVHHDRLLHVVIASEDFAVFFHVHPEDFGPVTPEMKKTGQYPVKVTLPKAGRYVVGTDFVARGQSVSRQFLVNAAGSPGMGKQEKDMNREKGFGALDVRFSSRPERIVAGKEVMLSYLFRRDGKAVTDLEPYLSAPMHLAIISADLNHFIHTHGEVPGAPAMAHHEHHGEMSMAVPRSFGPQVDVHVVFPAKGLYQIYGQVGYQGKVILTGFMVEVE